MTCNRGRRRLFGARVPGGRSGTVHISLWNAIICGINVRTPPSRMPKCRLRSAVMVSLPFPTAIGSCVLVVVGSLTGRTAAVLLGLLQQVNLLLKQLVLQPLVLQVEFDALHERRLANVAIVQAALDEDAGGGQRRLFLEGIAGLGSRRDLAAAVQQSFILEFLLHLLDGLIAQGSSERRVGLDHRSRGALHQSDRRRNT